jgi:thiamine-phosphate pyrophosphorylase
MHKQIDTLQYITSGTPAEQIQQAQEACEAGIRWVQLRVKNESPETVLATALKVKAICKQYNATFILNDHLDIAKIVDADGVHLGKEDSSPLTARKVLGSTKIIGGTSNTIEDIRQLVASGVDYIGLGPFRFTTTKEKLSPIIGRDGYAAIQKICRTENITTPIIAIGGITNDDVDEIIETGMYGIAVSAVITNAIDKKETIRSFYNHLKQTHA